MSTPFDFETLWGCPQPNLGDLDESFLPTGERPFEGAILAAQGSYPELNLQALLAQVLPGDRHDGAGDVYCPAFEQGSDAVAVVEWHHDEYLAWCPAATSMEQLDQMLEVLDTLRDMDADPQDVADQLAEGRDRQTRLASIDDADLREVLAKWPPRDPPKSYDIGQWSEALELLAEASPTDDLLARAQARLTRAAWITQALCGHQVSFPEDSAIDRALATLGDLPSQPGDAIYALWASWLTGKDDQAHRLVEALLPSKSALVADAARLVAGALEGQTTIGKADLAPVRAHLVERRARAQAQRGDKAKVRWLVMPALMDWKEGLLAYEGVEVLITNLQQVPADVAAFSKLRHLVVGGAVPVEVARLAQLRVLHTRSLPLDIPPMPQLEELRVTFAHEGGLAPVARMRGLTSLYLVAGQGLDTTHLAELQNLRHLELVGSDKEDTTFTPELAALPKLETLVFRGKLAPLPADWSRAVALREVRLQGVLPHDYRALASAPNLERLVLEPYITGMPTPELAGLEHLASLAVAGMLEDADATGQALARLGCRHHLRMKGYLSDVPDLTGIDVEHFELSLSNQHWPELAAALRSMKRLRTLTLQTIGAPEEPVDRDAWPQLRELHLASASNVSALIASLAEVPNLEHLDLGNADGTWIPETDRGAWLDGLATCTALTTAELAGTTLRPSDVRALAELPELRRLVARKCKLAELPALAPHLEHLDLRDNPLAYLPNLPPNLRTLLLGDTEITTLDHLAPPKHLEVLDLAAPTLTHLPPWLGELTALHTLRLSGPALDLEPALEAVARLPALRSLAITKVHHHRIPPTLLALSALERLELTASDYGEPLVTLRVAYPDTELIMA